MLIPFLSSNHEFNHENSQDIKKPRTRQEILKHTGTVYMTLVCHIYFPYSFCLHATILKSLPGRSTTIEPTMFYNKH